MSRAIPIMLPALVLSASCYTYTPISPTSITSDMTVRVEMAPTANEERVEGRVFEVGQASLILLPEGRPGDDTSPKTVSFMDVEAVDVRQFDATRTMLIVGGGAAVGIGALFLAGSNPGDTRGPGGEGDFNVLPLIRALVGSD